MQTLQAKYMPNKGKPGSDPCTSDALIQSLAKYKEKCARLKTEHYFTVVGTLQQVGGSTVHIRTDCLFDFFLCSSCLDFS